MSVTFERVLEAAAQANANQRVSDLGLVDPEALAKHVKLTTAVAAGAFLATVGLIVVLRVADLTDKQIALTSVVTLAVGTLAVVAALSGASAAATAYARQRIALHKAQHELADAKLQWRHTQLDLDHVMQRQLDYKLAMQIGANVVCNGDSQFPWSQTALDSFSDYCDLAAAYATDEGAEIPGNRTERVRSAMQVFARYEAGNNRHLMNEPGYSRIKWTIASFDDLKAA